MPYLLIYEIGRKKLIDSDGRTDGLIKLYKSYAPKNNANTEVNPQEKVAAFISFFVYTCTSSQNAKSIDQGVQLFFSFPSHIVNKVIK